MFPLKEDNRTEQVIENPSLLIRDKKASSVWELSVGKTAHFCSYRVQLLHFKTQYISFSFSPSTINFFHSYLLFLFLFLFLFLSLSLSVCVVVFLSECNLEVSSQNRKIQAKNHFILFLFSEFSSR
jgi:hypothetical protein